MITIFKDKKFRNRLIHLMIPFIVQELILSFTALIGTLMVLPIAGEDGFNIGGINGLLGMFNAYQIFFIFNTSISAIAFVGNLFISQHYGRGNIDLIEKDTYLLLKFVLIIGTIFTVIGTVIPEQIMSVFTPEQDAMIKAGGQYLRIFSISFIFTAITMIYYCVMRNARLEKIVAANSFGCLILVITLNAIFSYGIRMGVKGVALAIVIARAIECISAVVIENVKGHIHFRWKDFFALNLPLIKAFSRYLIVIFFAKLLWAVGSISISVVLGQINNQELLFANSLLTQMKTLVVTISNTTASAVCVIIGRELGANRLVTAKGHGDDTFRFTFVVGLIEIAILMLTMPIMYGINLDIFTTIEPDFSGPQSLQFLWMIYLICGSQLIFQASNSIICNGIFNAGGDIKVSVILDAFTYWILLIPALLILYLAPQFAQKFPLVIFAITMMEEVTKYGFNVKHYKHYKWVKNITGRDGFVFN